MQSHSNCLSFGLSHKNFAVQMTINHDVNLYNNTKFFPSILFCKCQMEFLVYGEATHRVSMNPLKDFVMVFLKSRQPVYQSIFVLLKYLSQL